MIKISYIKSNSRGHNIERCLALIKSEVTKGLKDAKRVVIKPNCSLLNASSAVTRSETLEPILKFITPYVKGQVTLAEGTLNGNTLDAFKVYDYLKLQGLYDFTIVDLNHDEYEEISLLNKLGEPENFRISKTMLESDYIISVTLPKTDKDFVFSSSIKNATIGSLVKKGDIISNLATSKLGQSLRMAQNYRLPIDATSPYWHENIAKLYEKLNIKLSVIDGFDTMQGNGPDKGEMISTHFAIASTNPVGADGLACNCSDINMSDIGYLDRLPLDKESVFIVGDDWAKNIVTIKKPDNFENIRHRKVL
jgi:uncharacterized protein (DUF362 family)